MIVCTMTALVVLTSGTYDLSTGEILAGYTDATLVGGAFNTVFGWSHYGTKAWEYLFGSNTTVIFKIIHLITILLGAVITSSLAWDISDTFNGLMMFPNLIGVVVLCPLVVKITKNYIARKIKNEDVAPILSYDEDLQKEVVQKP